MTNEISTSEGVEVVTGAILKTDVLGRITVGRPQREAILDAFDASGMYVVPSTIFLPLQRPCRCRHSEGFYDDNEVRRLSGWTRWRSHAVFIDPFHEDGKTITFFAPFHLAHILADPLDKVRILFVQSSPYYSIPSPPAFSYAE